MQVKKNAEYALPQNIPRVHVILEVRVWVLVFLSWKSSIQFFFLGLCLKYLFCGLCQFGTTQEEQYIGEYGDSDESI